MSDSAMRARNVQSERSKLACASGLKRASPQVNQVTLAELPIAFGGLELPAFSPLRGESW